MKMTQIAFLLAMAIQSGEFMVVYGRAPRHVLDHRYDTFHNGAVS